MNINVDDYKDKEGRINMCEVYQNSQNKARNEGEMRKAKETAFNLREMGLSDDMIAKAVNVSIAVINHWFCAATA